MAVDVVTLVALIYEAGISVIHQCKLAKQHPTEASRIAMRCMNILGELKEASGRFEGNVTLQASLIELRNLLEQVCSRYPRIRTHQSD